MELIKRANKLYADRRYEDALASYREAASVYGWSHLEVNIKLCLKEIAKLGNDNGLEQKNAANNEVSYLNSYFDRVYLVNLQRQVRNRLAAATELANRGVDFELFEATDGYAGEAFKRYQAYRQKGLGELLRYPEYAALEIRRGSLFIGSPGAIGYIFTYLRILEDAKHKGYNRILILEDDVLLARGFEARFVNFIRSIDEDWKVIQLGASQYGWDSVDMKQAQNRGFYYPRCLDTCGSFAIGLDSSVIDELIDAQLAFEAPFDHLPLGELYERHVGKCYVPFPNLITPDVTESTIRDKRCQFSHAEKMRWNLADFCFPRKKASIAILVSSRENLRYLPKFSKAEELPFALRLYCSTNDGLRPVHSVETLKKYEKDLVPPDKHNAIPEVDFCATLAPADVISEADIVNFIDYKNKTLDVNSSCLTEWACRHVAYEKGRVSVIVPTFKRSAHLRRALDSIIKQDYQDIEIVVVNDNGFESCHNEETREIFRSAMATGGRRRFVYIEHQFNRNGAGARNTGLLQATGEYICFLDDDDIYLPGRISKSVEKLRGAQSDVGAVYCGYIGWNSLTDDPQRYKGGDLSLELLMLEYKKHYLCTNTVTYKRDVALHLNGFDETYRRHQDLEFNLRFFRSFVVDVVPECLVRLHPEPTGDDNKIYGMDVFILKEKFLGQFCEEIERHGPDVAKEIYSRHWREVNKYIKDKQQFAKAVGEDYRRGLGQVLPLCFAPMVGS